jgi:hypothetical protein
VDKFVTGEVKRRGMTGGRKGRELWRRKVADVIV